VLEILQILHLPPPEYFEGGSTITSRRSEETSPIESVNIALK